MAMIAKVAVIGAGTMGAGIAAHLANAGLEVTLLDLDAAVARAAVERQVKAGGFMDPGFDRRIQAGAIGADLNLAAQADWVIEAVAERRDIKHGLFSQLQAACKPACIISSNTSTIPLSDLVDGLPEDFARRFLITHFFNPPRRMRLLELVSGPRTDPAVVAAIQAFADVRLGKGIVFAKDTPGFIANRIGVYWMTVAENEAIRLGLDIEQADALLGKPFGIPPTGVFGLLDLIGIDLMPAILGTLHRSLPPGDPVFEYPIAPPLVEEMIRSGRTGRKAAAGFFRISPDRKTREALDLKSGEYRPLRSIDDAAVRAATTDPRTFMLDPTPGGQFVAVVMEKTLAYSAALVPEISDTPLAVDDAMRLGYGWQSGPFDLIDRLGPGWLVERLQARGLPVPAFLTAAAADGSVYRMVNQQKTFLTPRGDREAIIRAEGVFSLSDHKRLAPPCATDAYASLWDIGDGVGLIEFHTKMNTMNAGLLATLERLFGRVGADFKALVFGGEATNFSAGADLHEFLAAAEEGEARMGEFIDQGQRLFRAVKFAPFPVVAAVGGWTVGGGCELALHCDAVQAAAELTMGLVETRIGVVPGWGGCKEMLLRYWRPDSGLPVGPVAPAFAAFDLIRQARVSSSAFEARRFGVLRQSDSISMNSDRVLADAKARALQLANDYAPPKPRSITLSGSSGASALRESLDRDRDLKRITAHDYVTGEGLIHILTGGLSADPARPVSEDAVYALERETFLALFRSPPTLDRIRHMLATGKPLKN
jgi:3-hydroxyacyl-CoA dehydrogenase